MGRNNIIPAVFLVLRESNKILLLQRFNTGWNDGMYTLPSGHVEHGESPQSAIIREAFEEVGIRIDVKDLRLICTLYRKVSVSEERVDFVFEANKWDGVPMNKEPEKASKILWRKVDSLPKNTIDFIKKTIQSDKNYLEFGY